MEMRGRMKDDIYTRQQHANGTLLLLKARLFQGISVRIPFYLWYDSISEITMCFWQYHATKKTFLKHTYET